MDVAMGERRSCGGILGVLLVRSGEEDVGEDGKFSPHISAFGGNKDE